MNHTAHWKDRPVLVTGGSGFGGSHLIRHLLDAGAIVTSIDLRHPSADRNIARAHFEQSDRHTSRLIPGAIQRLINHQPYDFGDRDDGGTTELDFLHIDDMCRAYLAAGEHVESIEVSGGAINFGSTHPVAISQVVQKISEAFDGTHRDPIFHGKKRERPLRKSLDISRAREFLGWQPQVNLDQGLAETLAADQSVPKGPLCTVSVRNPNRAVPSGRRRFANQLPGVKTPGYPDRSLRDGAL